MLTAAAARRLAVLLPWVKYGGPGTTAFLETLPPEPATAVGLFAEAGRAPDRFRRPAIQVLVRGDNTPGNRARSGHALAMQVLDALDGDSHVTWAPGTDDEVRVAWCLSQQSGPVSLGDDDNGVPRWSVRFDVELAGERA